MSETLTTGIIRSSNKSITLTSDNFLELRKEITSIFDKRLIIKSKLNKETQKLNLLLLYKFSSYIFVFGFFTKKPSALYDGQKKVVSEIKEELEQNFVSLKFSDKSQMEKSWLNCIDGFSELVTSKGFWDVTYSEQVDRVKARSYAGTAIKKESINYSSKKLEFLNTDLDPLYLPNKNGSDLYLYPKFLVLLKNNTEFGIFDLKEISINFELTKYVEDAKVPSDAEILNYTWKRVNKNGSKDLRYKENYKIPVVKYGIMVVKSESGLDEAYMFSKADEMIKFGQALKHHLGLIPK